MPYYITYVGEVRDTIGSFYTTPGKAKYNDWKHCYREWGVPYTSVRVRKVTPPEIDFSWVCRQYNLKLKTLHPCKYDGDAGEVVGTANALLQVYMHEGRHKGQVIYCHPTWRMEYE